MKSKRTLLCPQGEQCSDAGILVPPAGTKTTIVGRGGRPFVARRASLENLPLRDVVNDTKSRAFCGPTAVAAIVGEPVSLVRDAFRFARCGAGWVKYDRAPAIMGTTHREVQLALELFGFTGYWQTIPDKPTLAAFLETREGRMRTYPCIVNVTHHWVVVSGWQFCDTFSKGMVVEADEAPRRRARVKKVFLINGRVSPATDIPRKDYSAARASSAHVRNAREIWRQADA
jgi:hypothetical protein